MGGARLLDWLVETASNFIRTTDREIVAVEDFRQTLHWLYHRHIRPKVLPFRTHIPLYGLEAAAGKWGPEREVERKPEDWLEAPADLRLNDDLFVARVTGRSMEPLIPADSLCVFRAGVTGTRQDKRVLVVNLSETGDQRFTVKKYESTAAPGREGRRIILHPLNPEYESWEIDPDEDERVSVIAEFVQVLQTV
jgi:phage repressor protein C with HTH and peptisase S24 domain